MASITAISLATPRESHMCERDKEKFVAFEVDQTFVSADNQSKTVGARPSCQNWSL